MKRSTETVLWAAVLGVALYWLLHAAPCKSCGDAHGDVELGDPTVTTSDPSAQAGAGDYYTREANNE